MFVRVFCVCILVFLCLAGCTRYDGDFKLPGVYRIDVQQGNIVEQKMLDRLKPGMDKNQVRFIMGTPAVEDPFHKDRWDYIYTVAEGGGQRKQQHITIFFEDDKLAFIDGDIKVGERKTDEELKRPTRTVEVPIQSQKRKGLFGRMVDAIPFIGDDEPPPPPEKKDENEEEAEEEK